jgi:hypothetical protein
MSTRFASVFVGALLVVGAACSHDVQRPPPGQDPTTVQPGGPAGGGGGGGGSSDGGAVLDADTDALATCNDVVQVGSLVDQSAVGGDPVAGTGGTVTDGTYALSDSTVYVGAGAVGPTGTSLKETLVIAAGVAQRVRTTQTSTGSVETRTTFTLAFSGVTVAWSETCPTPSLAQQFSYTVTGNELRLIDSVGRVDYVYTLK